MSILAVIEKNRDKDAHEHKEALFDPYGSRTLVVGPEFETRKALEGDLAEKLDLLLGDKDYEAVGNIPIIDRRYQGGFDISIERDGVGSIAADCNNCCDMDGDRDNMVEDPEYIFCAGTDSVIFSGSAKESRNPPFTELVESFS